jgi:SAM-dependent methyltransferase
MTGVSSLFGGIDIYLFDQLQRGRIKPETSVLDAGCGRGRNLVYFLREGYTVFGLDQDPGAIHAMRTLAHRLAPSLPESNFRQEPLDESSFEDGCADTVLSCAVLHFARDEEHFMRLLLGTWRLVKNGGFLFCRLASSIGMENRVVPLGSRRFSLPDGTERFLVDVPYLLDLTVLLGGQILDPLKTTIVQDQRCMTTWILRKATRPDGLPP